MDVIDDRLLANILNLVLWLWTETTESKGHDSPDVSRTLKFLKEIQKNSKNVMFTLSELQQHALTLWYNTSH